MADFLTNLASRTLGVMPVAQPVVASRFAPTTTEVVTTNPSNDFSRPGPPNTSEAVTTNRSNDFSRSRVVTPPDSSREVGTSQERTEMMKEPIGSRGRSKLSDDERKSAFDADGKAEAPTIRVTIGRIEVRAKQAAGQNVAPRAARARPRPALSLDDYLKQRAGGRR